MVCPPATAEAGARWPRSISNYGFLSQTIKTRTLMVHGPRISAEQVYQFMTTREVHSEAALLSDMSQNDDDDDDDDDDMTTTVTIEQ
jgi:hypothetical protein